MGKLSDLFISKGALDLGMRSALILQLKPTTYSTG
jgi:hypothetical protein